MVFRFVRLRHGSFFLGFVIGFIQLRLYHYWPTKFQDFQENDVFVGSISYNQAVNYVSFRPTYNDTYKPPDTPGAFVHVGKTGGSTMSQLLRYGCHSFMLKWCNHTMNATDESMISKLTTYYHTPDFEIGTNRSHEFYVITIRDPLDRIISAYLCNHPDNMKVLAHNNILNKPKYQNLLENEGPEAAKLYYDGIYNNYRKKWKFKLFRPAYACMPTLEAFAQKLKGGEMMEFKNKIPTEKNIFQKSDFNCSEKVKLIFFHKNAPPMQHFNWNLQSTVQAMNINFNRSSIFLIRTEHQNRDWIQANQYLGQEAKDVKVPEVALRNHTSNYPIKNILSDSGREILCQALKPEYELYMKLLRSAVNLSTEQKQESLNMVKEKCPYHS